MSPGYAVAFCKRRDGSFKPVPCCTRLRGGNAADGPTGAQRGAQAGAIDNEEPTWPTN